MAAAQLNSRMQEPARGGFEVHSIDLTVYRKAKLTSQPFPEAEVLKAWQAETYFMEDPDEEPRPRKRLRTDDRSGG